MSRRGKVRRSLSEPDPIYNSRVVTLLINRVLKAGKKSLAQKIVYNAMSMVAEKTEKNPALVLEEAVKNVTPQVGVKPRKIRGSTCQVPIKIRLYRGTNLSVKWLTEVARARPGKSMAKKLSDEILDAAGRRGSSVRKKEQTHKLANANRVFAHFKY